MVIKLDFGDIEIIDRVFHVKKLNTYNIDTELIEVEICSKVLYLIALGAGRFIPWYPAKIK